MIKANRHDKLKEECGLVLLHQVEGASDLTIQALLSLQHRGQQSCGIYFKSKNLSQLYKNVGLVREVFTEDSVFSDEYNNSVGHVRYATSSENKATEAQPFQVLVNGINLVIAHNGHIINQEQLRLFLKSTNQKFETKSDSEIILLYLKHFLESGYNLEKSIEKLLHNISGAYSVAGFYGDSAFAFRDKKGFRPLVFGRRLNKDNTFGYVFSSETCALEMIEASYTREVNPGEICILNDSVLKAFQVISSSKTSMCSFEYIYFSRSDSVVFNRSVYQTRTQFGEQLAKEEFLDFCDIDIVIAVPDSGTAAAIGYAQMLNKPFHLGLIKNSYVGRTFITPNQSKREAMVKLKLNALNNSIQGKNLVVVDDSLVRGTTSRKIVDMLKRKGAKSVHLRVAAPPIKHSCFFGVDTPETKDLIANNMTILEMNQQIGSDSLSFLSWAGFINVLNEKNKYCMACFNGDYPLAIYRNSFHNVSYEKEAGYIPS